MALKEGVRIMASKIAAGSEWAIIRCIVCYSEQLTYAVENGTVICIDCARTIFPPAKNRKICRFLFSIVKTLRSSVERLEH